MPNYLDSLILGTVEGLTEFLPVSSTGHLILSSHFLALKSSGAFEMIIQAGAILAVIWHYRKPFFASIRPAVSMKGPSFNAWLKVFLAFIPAAVVGLAFAKAIKSLLFGVGPVAGALVVGGIAMIIVERWLPQIKSSEASAKNDSNDAINQTQDLETLSSQLSYKQAFGIGLFQCLSLWPGTSRSMSTILGGRILGLSTQNATEFSFWLAIPTLLAASAYDLLKHSNEFSSGASWGPLLVATVVSFLSALIVIRVFLRFVKTHSLEVFGWYRIALGLLLYFFVL